MHLKRSHSASSWISISSLAISLLGVTTSVSASDYFCGKTWPDASQSCRKRCTMPGGDVECIDSLGVGYECFGFTGCQAKIAKGEIVDPDAGGSGSNNNASVEGQGGSNINNDIDSGVGNAGSNNNFCGAAWIDAMKYCSIPCPLGTECSSGLKCYAATNCDRPLERLEANMLVTLLGADSTMEYEDADIFGGTIGDMIRGTLEDEKVSLDGVNLGEQSVAGRRQLSHRYQKRKLKGWHENSEHWKMRVANTTHRMLPTGSSALDVNMVITGDYRPPPYIDLNAIAEDSINRQGEEVVQTLRDRGSYAGRSFFERVEGIEALAKEKSTPRPSTKPTRYPTLAPTFPPTDFPSSSPSESPFGMPSIAPSRDHDQVITTGSGTDLQLGDTTTFSYGYIFNIRTKEDGGVIVINGFDFYTDSTELVNYELWTRMGSFKDHKGTYEGWDLIAAGSIKGRGIGRYTSIPDDMFTPVSIPGGGGVGGTRAFYLTLDTKALVYKIGEGETSDAFVQYENEDVEVWEGESVLSYPFPSIEDFFFYRYPRQLLGTIRYNRLPCKPFSLYGPVTDLPCPSLPTGSPTIPRPTSAPVTPPPSRSPVTNPPSGTPTISPIGLPTEMPTISRAPAGYPTESPTEPQPTESPTTAEPSHSPIVPMRANIVSVFRNVPEREMNPREIQKFLEIIEQFLKRHTQQSMTIDGIDFWHHKLTLADADEEAASPQISKNIRNNSKGKGHTIKAKHKEVTPQVPAVEITMILKISLALLPLEYLGDLARISIDENQSELLALLNEQSAFYSYFKYMDGIKSRTIPEVTKAPTGAPTTLDYLLAGQEEVSTANVEENESTSGDAPIMLAIGLSVGALWLLLTLLSVSYVLKKRRRMRQEHAMEDLLRQDKAATAMEIQETSAELAVEDEDGSTKPGKSSDETNIDEEDPNNGKAKDNFTENDKSLLSSVKGKLIQQLNLKGSFQGSESSSSESSDSDSSSTSSDEGNERRSFMSGLGSSLKGSFASADSGSKRRLSGLKLSLKGSFASNSSQGLQDYLNGGSGQIGSPPNRPQLPKGRSQSLVVPSSASMQSNRRLAQSVKVPTSQEAQKVLKGDEGGGQPRMPPNRPQIAKAMSQSMVSPSNTSMADDSVQSRRLPGHQQPSMTSGRGRGPSTQHGVVGRGRGGQARMQLNQQRPKATQSMVASPNASVASASMQSRRLPGHQYQQVAGGRGHQSNVNGRGGQARMPSSHQLRPKAVAQSMVAPPKASMARGQQQQHVSRSMVVTPKERRDGAPNQSSRR